MIDIDLFRKILKEDGYIEYGDIIPIELFELMCNSPIDKVKTLFKKNYDTNKIQILYVQVKCLNCGKSYILELSKNKMFDLILCYKRSMRGELDSKCLCAECKLRKEEMDREQLKMQYHNRELVRKKNTEEYISTYLNPNNSWRNDVSSNNKFNQIKEVYVNWREIKEHIRNMDYYYFLETPYWKAVSEKVKSRANYKCQICNSSSNLCAHHRSYANHGDEVHNLEDLICICQDCHTKYHFE